MIIVFLFCTGSIVRNKKYMSYKEFKKKYSYFYSLDEYSQKCKEASVLKVYLKAKEFELEPISNFENVYLTSLNDEEKVIQLGKILLQIPKQNKINENREMIWFFSGEISGLEREFGEKNFIK